MTASSIQYVANNNTLPEMYRMKSTTLLNGQKKSSSNRLAYVDALVDVNAHVIESIWHMNSQKNSSNNNSVVPLCTFIQEVLKRSRTTYSTLQTALFYLFRARPAIKLHLERMNNSSWQDAYLSCGRRMFLASLVVASKFVQDKTYRNSAWAKIAGLPVSEINTAERIFLNIIDYRLYINQPIFEKWHHLLHFQVERKTMNQPTNIHDFVGLPFAAVDHGQALQVGLLDDYNCHNRNGGNNTGQEIIVSPVSSQQTPSPRTPRNIVSSHGSNSSNGWTLVLSPNAFLPPVHPVPVPIMTTTTQTNKRKRFTPPHPILSMSLPSSIHSSPLQTPTHVRNNNSTCILNWNNSPTASFDHNQYQQHRSIMNSIDYSGNYNNGSSNKKRKFTNISNVRHQQQRFYY